MNLKHCPHCPPSKTNPNVRRFGSFRRKSDSRTIQRFACLDCGRTFSNSTNHPCRNQNKRHFNERIRRLLCSGVSQRRIAKILNLSPTTVARKFDFLSDQAKRRLVETNSSKPQAKVIEFDDMETFEHTKYKPLSITLAVEEKTRRILGVEVSQMPPTGLLAKRGLEKYGPRRDQRSIGRRALFNRIKDLVADGATIKSDQNPFYLSDVRSQFPNSVYEQHKGQRGSIVGQGELKKIRFDPLFSLNHTCAMFRANVNRLFRKTWCTTKKPEKLAGHLAIYAVFHNLTLLHDP